MIKLAKTALLSLAIAATTITATAAPALADGRRHYHERSHRGGNDAAVLGLFGFAAGAMLGAAIANEPRYVEPAHPRYVEPAYPRYVEPDYPRYVDQDYPPPPRRHVRAAPAYSSLQPWSPEWYDYCSARYRSFNPRTGTFVGYDGRQHFCNAG